MSMFDQMLDLYRRGYGGAEISAQKRKILLDTVLRESDYEKKLARCSFGAVTDAKDPALVSEELRTRQTELP